MRDYTSKLVDQLVIIYEMDGHAGVAQYARDNGIPLAVCRRIVANYAVTRGLRRLATGR
jgi:hypothetical protein